VIGYRNISVTEKWLVLKTSNEGGTAIRYFYRP